MKVDRRKIRTRYADDLKAWEAWCRHPTQPTILGCRQFLGRFGPTREIALERLIKDLQEKF